MKFEYSRNSRNDMRDLLFTLAETTGDKSIILKCKTIELTEIFDDYALNPKTKDKELDELINIVEQFKVISKNFKKGKKNEKI